MAELYKNSPAVGILLANLGTPTAPKRQPVAKFLREFLSYPRVVDLRRYLWLPLLNLVIIPLRASRSAAAYRKIWWPEGSPLLILTRRLADHLGWQPESERVQDYHLSAAWVRAEADSIRLQVACPGFADRAGTYDVACNSINLTCSPI